MNMEEPISRVMFSKKSDDWQTPDDLYNQLNYKYNFTLDPCCKIGTNKCDKFFTIDDDGLMQNWSGENVFCNPPYSQINLWIRKAYKEAKKANLIVLLVPSRTDTKWFHTYVKNHATVEFLKGRLTFKGAKHNAPFPSMLIIYDNRREASL